MDFSKPKSSVVRKTTVRVAVSKPTTPQAQRPPAGPDPNRFKAALNRTNIKSQSARKPPPPVQRALAPSRGVKRKSATPQPVFSDDEGDDSSDIGASDSDASRKRIKSSVSSVESLGPRRTIILAKAFQEDTKCHVIQGADATSGIYSSKFKNPWGDEDFRCVKLKYPSRSTKEKFELKWPKNENDDYKPMEDITETIKTIVQHYFPDELRMKYLDDDTGFERRFTKAWVVQDVDEFADIVKDFNGELQKLIEDGTVRKELLSKSGISLDWTKRILDQIYARTVSPKVETLRAYENGSDDVYGELLPRFCSTIFKQTKLTHEQVFVDLGSGVGNAVLQAALEIGCESWGIEKMKNPCDLADLQAKEFPQRTRLWGLSTGPVKLIRGDFTENTEIAKALQRADVVLVNNQAFTPALNDRLRDMFFDLKDGCQVVSLKPFVQVGFKIGPRNFSSVQSLFVQKKLEYFSNSVSWTDQGGDYFIATKDPRRLRDWMAKNPTS